MHQAADSPRPAADNDTTGNGSPAHPRTGRGRLSRPNYDSLRLTGTVAGVCDLRHTAKPCKNLPVANPDRLTGLDSSFLHLERDSAHMHVAG